MPSVNATTTKHLETLAEAVRGLEAVFSCGGTVELPAPVELEFEDERVIRVAQREGFGTYTVGKRLAARCAPAPFGIGSETRHDPRVRSGGQLLAHRGGLAAHGLDLGETGLLSEIHRALCPADPKPPVATLYALNVYERGGHFVRHKDTPRTKDALGTLVVCLPVEFMGGRLVLRHDTVRSFDWESHRGYGGLTPPYRIRWAAFYGDVDHEIEPVREGTRVTLTWTLRHATRNAPARRVAATTDAELESAFAAAALDHRFMPKGGTLGVPCLHLYTETPAITRPTASLAASSLAHLKGRDRLFAQAAQGSGLTVRCRPYLYDTGCELSWRLGRMPTAAEAKIFRQRRLGAYKLEKTLPIEHAVEGWPPSEDVTWILRPPWVHRSAYADDDDDGRNDHDDLDAATELLGQLEYSATDYFGNEGGDAAFYVAATLLVDIPPASKRRPPPRRARD